MTGTRRWVAVAALCACLGATQSALLTWDHQVHRVDPGSTDGLCARGSGCEISRYGRTSELSLGDDRPGLPVSALGVGYFVALLALFAIRLVRGGGPSLAALAFLLSWAGLGVSLFLALLSLGLQGRLCPACTVIYGITAMLVWASWAAWPSGDRARGRALLSGLASRASAGVYVLFCVATAATYVLYAPAVQGAMEARQAALLEEARTLHLTPRLEVDVTGRPTTGDAAAPVSIVEIVDYGCGHCRKLFHTLDALREERPTQIRVTHVSFPLDSSCNPHVNHPGPGCLLARAAVCAHDQDRFADLSRWLFEHGGHADRDELVWAVGEREWDAGAFDRCLDAPATHAAVDADIALAHSLGVTGTPVFLVNGHRVEGGRERALIEVMIDGVRGHGE